jgi:hypothetical protein
MAEHRGREISRGEESSAAFGPLLTPVEVLTGAPDAALAGYDAGALGALTAMARYVVEFLTAEHAALGRSGPVCPYAAPATARGLVQLTASNLENPDDAEAVASGMRRFGRLLADEGERQEHRAIVAVFPRLREPSGAEAIERLQKALKLFFVKRRLMIGQFYPSCSAPGLWNADFRPLQSPAIALAIRTMTIADAPFMLERPEYAEAYIGHYGRPGAERIAAAAERAPRPAEAAEPGARSGARP